MTSSKPYQENKTVFPVLVAISVCHFLNDTVQSIIPAIYPVLKKALQLNFFETGVITFTFQITASLLQPFVGAYSDRKPLPYSLAVGMLCSLFGVILLSIAPNFLFTLVAVGLVGVGSSIFHPESSKLAYVAAGDKRGTAQSLFQVGGNAGAAVGPLLATLLIAGTSKSGIAWVSVASLLAIGILLKIGGWYRDNLYRLHAMKAHRSEGAHLTLSKKTITFSIVILLILIFSKYFYLASISSYYTFYLINTFHVTIKQSQILLSVFLASVAAGTFMGGPLGDRFGRKYVIWVSILGVAPFTLALPYANLWGTVGLSVIIGLIISSAFSAILVYAQELLPGKVGTVSGLFFGFAFGMGGLGSAILGNLADHTSIGYVYKVCSFLPLIGIFTAFLPNIGKHRTPPKGTFQASGLSELV